jgi:hypothetical protein
MKKKHIAVLLVTILASVGVAHATPDYQTYNEYFNATTGQYIGWRIWYCFGGGNGSGSTSDAYTQEATACDASGTPGCSELGLEQISGCDICVSGQYKDLYDQNLVPNPCS